MQLFIVLRNEDFNKEAAHTLSLSAQPLSFLKHFVPPRLVEGKIRQIFESFFMVHFIFNQSLIFNSTVIDVFNA